MKNRAIFLTLCLAILLCFIPALAVAGENLSSESPVLLGVGLVNDTSYSRPLVTGIGRSPSTVTASSSIKIQVIGTGQAKSMRFCTVRFQNIRTGTSISTDYSTGTIEGWVYENTIEIGEDADYGEYIIDSVTIGDASGNSCTYRGNNNIFTSFPKLPNNLGSLTFMVINPKTQKYGEDLFWTFDNGHLSITGKGEMHSFTDYAHASVSEKQPWESFRNNIASVTLSEGAESIGNYAFGGCSNLQEITIPNSVTYVGDNAFKGCTSLSDINYQSTEKQKAKMSIQSNNDYLLNATWHFDRPSSIEWRALPTTLTYEESTSNSKLDASGGIILARYKNGLEEEVALSADMVSGFDITTTGIKTLTVTYESKKRLSISPSTMC